MRISDWSSDVCSSDLDSNVALREQLDEKLTHAEPSILVQTGKTKMHWQDDRVAGMDDRLSKLVILEVPVVNGTEVLLLAVNDLHSQDNPSPLPQVWFTGPELSGDEVVGFTIQLSMGANAALLIDGQLEVAEVNWAVLGEIG